VDIGETHIDPHMIRPCAFAPHGRSAWCGSSETAFIVD
jgi:hypothetical protein